MIDAQKVCELTDTLKSKDATITRLREALNNIIDENEKYRPFETRMYHIAKEALSSTEEGK